MDSEKEKEFMGYLIKNPKVVWVAYFDGDLDAGFIVWTDNILEFEQIYDSINEKYGVYFQYRYFSIATKIEYLKYKFLNNEKDNSSLIFGDCLSKFELDKLDKKILRDLNQNGRTTLVELANRHSTSAKVIKMRIDKLLKKKIIIGFNVKINHNILGYTHRKVLLNLNNVSKNRINILSSFLRNHRNVIYLVKPIGSYDFEFELMTESNEKFHQIIKELRTKFAQDIKSYDTVIHYEEPKSGQWLIS